MFVYLLTDIFFYLIIISLLIYILYVRRTPDMLRTWSYVFKNKTGIISIVVLSFFMLIAFFDSIHVKKKILNNDTNQFIYSNDIQSLLDIILLPTYENFEKSYSSPFSSKLYSKETIKLKDGSEKRIYPGLAYKGNHNKYSKNISANLVITAILSLVKSFIIFLFFYLIIFYRTLYERKNIFFTKYHN